MLFSLTAPLVAASVAAPAPAPAPDAQPAPPSVIVIGRGEVRAPPDRAIVRLGAVAQATDAGDAHRQVSQTMRRVLDALGKLGLPRDALTTERIALDPVYEQPRDPGPAAAPRLVGYRATNLAQVRVDDLTRAADVVDAAVRAGATQIEEVVFRLSNEAEAQQRALRAAVHAARAKAQTVASALEMRLDAVIDVTEGGVSVFEPRAASMDSFGGAAMMSTPVEPGQVVVEAQVTARYRLVRP